MIIYFDLHLFHPSHFLFSSCRSYSYFFIFINKYFHFWKFFFLWYFTDFVFVEQFLYSKSVQLVPRNKIHFPCVDVVTQDLAIPINSITDYRLLGIFYLDDHIVCGQGQFYFFFFLPIYMFFISLFVLLPLQKQEIHFLKQCI